MSLIITFMFEPAKLQMNWASASGARNLRRETAAPADAGLALNRPLRTVTATCGEPPHPQHGPQGSVHVIRLEVGTRR
jgi:hypothetical protein